MNLLNNLFQNYDVSETILIFLSTGLILFGGIYFLCKTVLKDMELTLPNGFKFKGSSKSKEENKSVSTPLVEPSKEKDTEETFNILKTHYNIIRRIGVEIIKLHLKNIAYITYYALNYQKLPHRDVWIDKILRGYFFNFKKMFDSIDYLTDVDFSNYKLFLEELQRSGIDLYSNYADLYSKFEEIIPEIKRIFEKETENVMNHLKSNNFNEDKIEKLNEVSKNYHKKAYKYLTSKIDKRAYEILFYLLTKIEKHLKEYLDGSNRKNKR